MIEDIQKKYSRHPSLFFYGLGNGIFYKVILKNAAHKKIIVIEPDIEIKPDAGADVVHAGTAPQRTDGSFK